MSHNMKSQENVIWGFRLLVLKEWLPTTAIIRLEV